MMITRNFIGVLALCLCALAACTSSKESKKTLTVLSWNVWHGGHSKTYSGKGCEGTIDILKKSDLPHRDDEMRLSLGLCHLRAASSAAPLHGICTCKLVWNCQCSMKEKNPFTNN